MEPLQGTRSTQPLCHHLPSSPVHLLRLDPCSYLRLPTPEHQSRAPSSSQYRHPVPPPSKCHRGVTRSSSSSSGAGNTSAVNPTRSTGPSSYAPRHLHHPFDRHRRRRGALPPPTLARLRPRTRRPATASGTATFTSSWVRRTRLPRSSSLQSRSRPRCCSTGGVRSWLGGCIPRRSVRSSGWRGGLGCGDNDQSGGVRSGCSMCCVCLGRRRGRERHRGSGEGGGLRDGRSRDCRGRWGGYWTLGRMVISDPGRVGVS